MVKQKVRLVFVKSFLEIPTAKDTFSKEIEIEVPESIDSEVHLTSAVVMSEDKQQRDIPGGDAYATIWDYSDESRLIGKLLTYVDATYVDKEQRQAHKNLIKDLVYGYAQELRTRAIQIIESHKNDK